MDFSFNCVVYLYTTIQAPDIAHDLTCHPISHYVYVHVVVVVCVVNDISTHVIEDKQVVKVWCLD